MAVPALRAAGRACCRLAAVAALLAAPAAAVEIPPATDHAVHDYAGVILNEDTRAIETLARELESRCGISLSVVTLKSLDGEPIEDLASRWAAAWDIGGADHGDGLLLLISVGDRLWRVETRRPGQTVALDDDAAEWYDRGDFSVGTRRAVEGLARAAAARSGVELDSLPGAAVPRSLLASGGKVILLMVSILLLAAGGPALVWWLLLRGRPEDRAGGRP